MKKTVFIIIVVLVSSCTKEIKTPEYVIPHDKMVSIIGDMHIIDGLFTVNNVRRKFTKDSIDYYNAIFTNHGYTRSDFDTSINFYSNNIDEYDKIYEEVLNRLNEMETIIKKESAEKQAIKDAKRKKRQNIKKIEGKVRRMWKEKTV
ncbi:MAG: DUF4296 domain-containing protein [Bacteroidales bacterium]|nr:DUF4296 domain-containing protein [Bacteroidales bacterium]